MSNVRFIGLDVHAETIAVAVAEPAGDVRSLGVIPNRIEAIRKLVKKLGPVKQLRVCYEAGPTGYVVYWQPVTAVGELSKQGVPDVSFGGVPNPNPTLKALSDLAGQVNGAVLMGHSQSGSFPLAAALLNPAVAKGLVLLEPRWLPGELHGR